MTSHNRTLTALFVGIPVLCATLGAQLTVQPTAPVDADQLMQTVRTLSSAEFEGRRTGTPGNAKARAWIVERFRRTGLVPSGDGFLMPFTFTPRSNAQATPVTGEGVNVVGTCRG